MVQAVINISEHTNRILNILKAKYGLRTKSESIDLMAEQYEEDVLEPELRPGYIRKAKRIMEQKPIKVGSVENLRKRYGLR
ncbi:MAG: antitoxin [Euryarchaeota archaeon CG_4_9_14_3_um_filter_38_12]|nr:MAG: antitoxin [Euryarchaeota archaeon CG_4_9_14_3_um_filter_38_12]